MPRDLTRADLRRLRCDCCEAWTTHALDWSKTAYVCECGNEIVYHVNAAKPMLAMDLRESPVAQQAFESWILELE